MQLDTQLLVSRRGFGGRHGGGGGGGGMLLAELAAEEEEQEVKVDVSLVRLVHDDVRVVLEHLLAAEDKQLQQQTNSHKRQPRRAHRRHLVARDGVPHRLPERRAALHAHALRQRARRQPARLRDHDPVCGALVEQKLRHLRRLAAAGLARDNDTAMRRDGIEHRLLVRHDRRRIRCLGSIGKLRSGACPRHDFWPLAFLALALATLALAALAALALAAALVPAALSLAAHQVEAGAIPSEASRAPRDSRNLRVPARRAAVGSCVKKPQLPFACKFWQTSPARRSSARAGRASDAR